MRASRAARSRILCNVTCSIERLPLNSNLLYRCPMETAADIGLPVNLQQWLDSDAARRASDASSAGLPGRIGLRAGRAVLTKQHQSNGQDSATSQSSNGRQIGTCCRCLSALVHLSCCNVRNVRNVSCPHHHNRYAPTDNVEIQWQLRQRQRIVSHCVCSTLALFVCSEIIYCALWRLSNRKDAHRKYYGRLCRCSYDGKRHLSVLRVCLSVCLSSCANNVVVVVVSRQTPVCHSLGNVN